MKKLTLGGIGVVFLLFAACQSNTNSRTQVQDSLSTVDESYIDTVHTSQNSLDWQGTYEGITPCADCPGIKTTVELRSDETFTYQAAYLERDFSVADSGKFMWHDNGSAVHLQGENTDMKFKVGENQLFQLDQSGQQITGDLADHYILKKIR
ncbi:copper resistance protein NlpE [Sphingobacterium sp. SGG-5]|uniref:copper resistance protein NlpE n=1 Tax=Sphingobacterium sp. SGG-5 TaxID=2710881 RepID=UPI0013EBE8A1|nr:copper resistance protein NlpE [Sphingobacterium sp. SGG-5]NGM62186.1 copper resistance protein NlpE [Sphingobacterium sp. SGG-5]